MLSASERYRNDPLFKRVVDSLYSLIDAAEMTPTEIREAAMLAQIIWEERNARRRFIEPADLTRL